MFKSRHYSKPPTATKFWQHWNHYCCCAGHQIRQLRHIMNDGENTTINFLLTHLNVSTMLTRWVSDVTGRWGDDVKCDMVTWSQSILCCQGQYYYAVRMPGPWAQYRLYNIAAQFSLSWSTHITATSYFCPNLWPRDLRRKLTILWSYFSKKYQKVTLKTLYINSYSLEEITA